jgi:plastocyanin
MRRARAAAWLSAAGLMVTVLACGGGGYSNPMQPTPSPPPSGGGGGGTPAPMSVTITITGNGVTASGSTLASGGTITWMNSDNRTHDMESDPHPQHSDCPNVGSGDLNPGQQRTTAPITTVRVCGFHDHLNPDSPSMKGTITVQ